MPSEFEQAVLKASKLPEMPKYDKEDVLLESDTRPAGYHQLKRRYFPMLRGSLNPLYSQEAARRMVVVHDVMIEGARTQKQVRNSTGLPKSTVSEQVRVAVHEGILSVEKMRSSRVKVYRPAISLMELLMAHYKRSKIYAVRVRKSLMGLIDRVNLEDDDSCRLKNRLEDFERAYGILEEFTGKMWALAVDVL